MSRRPASPRCRFCGKLDDPANMVAEQHRAGVARGSTRYTMVTYYHHADCLAAFEANEARLNAEAQAERDAMLAELLAAYKKDQGR